MTDTPIPPDSTAVVGVAAALMDTFEKIARDSAVAIGKPDAMGTIFGAMEEALALASRSTQPEGEAKPLPQPEAAASGGVAEIERLRKYAVEAFCVFGQRVASAEKRGGEDRERAAEKAENVTLAAINDLAKAAHSLAAQARAQALEEAAKVADSARCEMTKQGAWDEGMRDMGVRVAQRIRALIPQPSVPAGE